MLVYMLTQALVERSKASNIRGGEESCGSLITPLSYKPEGNEFKSQLCEALKICKEPRSGSSGFDPSKQEAKKQCGFLDKIRQLIAYCNNIYSIYSKITLLL